jgi:tetratricopeptide (TPR) repeat protein
MRARWALFIVSGLLLYGVIQVSASTDPSSETSSGTGGNSQDSDNPCYYPEQLEAAGYVEKALAEYDRLAGTPGLTCAVDGYVSLSVTATADANATATSTAKDSTPDPFTSAQSLYDAGYEEEAKEEAVKIIATYPAASVPDDLDNKEGITGFLKDFWKAFSEPSGLFGWLIWGVIAIGLIFWGRKILKGKLGRSVDIDPFAQGAAEGDIGSAMADLIQHEYHKTRTQDRASSPKIVTEATPAYPVAEAAIKILPDSGQILAKAWEAIKSVGIEAYVLGGTMISHPKRGAGANVTLHKDKVIIASQQIWFSTYFGYTPDKIEDDHYLDLAETVAIWLHEQLPRKVASQQPSASVPGLTHLWTRWQSYALFRNGVRQAQTGNKQRSLELYARSLADDPYFAPAMLNHAATSIEFIAGDGEIEDPVEQYTQQISILDEILAQSGMTQQIRIAALYNQGAAIEYSTPWRPPAPGYDRATVVSHKLKEIYQQAGTLDTRSQLMAVPVMPDQGDTDATESMTKRQDELLRRFYPSVEMLMRIVDVRTDIFSNAGRGVPRKVEAIIKELAANERIALPDNRIQYGLACFYAAAYSFLKDRATATKCIDHLLKAIEGESSVAAWAALDPSLAPVRDADDWWNLFAAVVEREPSPSAPKDPPTRTEHVLIFEEDSPLSLLPDVLQSYIDRD